MYPFAASTPSSTTLPFPAPPPAQYPHHHHHHHQPMAHPQFFASQAQVPRPPTPPSLDDVPVQYIVDKLHRMGPTYWHRPDTADCIILVPTDVRRLSQTPSFGVPQTGVPAHSQAPPLDHRRASEPTRGAGTAPSVSKLPLHQIFLTTQSSLFRKLLSRSSVLDLNSGRTPGPAPRFDTPYARDRQESITTLNARTPRLLPSHVNKPVVFLPLPDYASFPHVVHYLYFGTPVFMERALTDGSIRWEGLMKNIEYLGLYESFHGIREWLHQWRATKRAFSPTYSLAEESERETVSGGSEEETTESSDEWSSGDEWDVDKMLGALSMSDPFTTDPSAAFATQAAPCPLEVDPIAS